MKRSYRGSIVIYFVYCLITQCAYAECSIEQLPKALQTFIEAEQGFDCRTEALRHRKGCYLPRWNSPYATQYGMSFSITGCWVKALTSDLFAAPEMSESDPNLTRSQFFRKNPKTFEVEVLFFTHPESVPFYQEVGIQFYGEGTDCQTYCATATSSERTLLIWTDSETKPFRPTLVKTSIGANLGGMQKTVGSEGLHAVSVSRSLEIQKIMDPTTSNFNFFKEVLFVNFLPHDFESLKARLEEGAFERLAKFFKRGAGMIVREVPDELLSGQINIVSSIGLFGNPLGLDSEGRSLPFLLRKMKGKPASEVYDYVNQRILEPFAKEWVNAVTMWGIQVEPHAQNLSMELDQKGDLTGRFWHRDFESVLFSETFREVFSLPNVGRTAGDDGLYGERLDLFIVNVLHSLERAIFRWEALGLIHRERGKSFWAEREFARLMMREIGEALGPIFTLPPMEKDFENARSASSRPYWVSLATDILNEIRHMRAQDMIARTSCTPEFEYDPTKDLDIKALVSNSCLGLGPLADSPPPDGLNPCELKVREKRIEALKNAVRMKIENPAALLPWPSEIARSTLSALASSKELTFDQIRKLQIGKTWHCQRFLLSEKSNPNATTFPVQYSFSGPVQKGGVDSGIILIQNLTAQSLKSKDHPELIRELVSETAVKSPFKIFAGTTFSSIVFYDQNGYGFFHNDPESSDLFDVTYRRDAIKISENGDLAILGGVYLDELEPTPIYADLCPLTGISSN